MAFVKKIEVMGNLKYELKRMEEHEHCSRYLKTAIKELRRVLMNEYATTNDNSLTESFIIHQKESGD